MLVTDITTGFKKMKIAFETSISNLCNGQSRLNKKSMYQSDKYLAYKIRDNVEKVVQQNIR